LLQHVQWLCYILERSKKIDTTMAVAIINYVDMMKESSQKQHHLGNLLNDTKIKEFC